MQERYYTAAAVRELDRLAIEDHRIPGFKLMRRAGKAAFRALRNKWPRAEQLIIFCGSGNNGGDGFIVAGLARQAGLLADVYLCGRIEALHGDALKAFHYAEDLGASITNDDYFAGFDAYPRNTVIVDALLGTGLSGGVRTPYRRLIDLINASAFPVLAVDIPSGLSADSGEILGAAVEADLTVTFIGRKIGQVRGEGPAHCGELVYDDLGVPPAIFDQVSPVSV